MSKQKYDSYDMFMKKLNLLDVRTLTKEEEYEMLKEIKENPGNKELEEKFIAHNLRMVIKFVAKYKKLHYDCELDISDLINEGYFGLRRAIEKFDLNKGYKFSTYAMFWIKQTVARSAEEKNNVIRKPLHFSQLIKLTKKLQSEFSTINGRMATNEELSNMLIAYGYNYSADKLKKLLLLDYEIDSTSLDKPIEEDSNIQCYMHELIPEENKNNAPEKSAIYECMKESIEIALCYLNPKEQEVIRLRFGLQGEKIHTLEEIGEKLNLTRERIRQIEEKSLKKLKNVKELKGYSEEYETKENKIIEALINEENITNMYFKSGGSYLEFYKNNKEKIQNELQKIIAEENYISYSKKLDSLYEKNVKSKTRIKN